ncbi:MAG: hypothetical protein EZS28_023111 [Streblomastix strix]|uniref:Uncharacterized protein n=1 Tax=Streblomastix strix TaxID=222440 RepID=A0A5J4VFY6_9EUKA|nr:MAG: hypothetical protein EZS28_023111 [Streblomastix strix]
MKIKFKNRFTFQTAQIWRLLTEERNNSNDLQDIELYATDGHFCSTVQHTNQQLCNSGSQRSGAHFHNAFNRKWSKVKLYIHPPIPVLNSVLQKMKQDKAQGKVIAPIWPGQSCKQDSGDRTENERQGSKTSSRQCGRLPSGPVADVGRDLLMRCMKMREFSEDGVNLLFKGQRFNTVKRDFYSLAL